MASNKKTVTFTEDQIKELVTSIFSSVNIRIADRIVQTISDTDVHHAPSAGAVKTYTEAQVKAKLMEIFMADDDLTAETIQKVIANMLETSPIIQDSINETVTEFMATELAKKADNFVSGTYTIQPETKLTLVDNTGGSPAYLDIDAPGVREGDVVTLKPADEMSFKHNQAFWKLRDHVVVSKDKIRIFVAGRNANDTHRHPFTFTWRADHPATN